MNLAWSAALAASVLVSATSDAGAHSWYTGLHNEKGEACCGDRDCGADLNLTDVEGRPGGFYIKSLNAFVTSDRVKPAVEDDGYYHVCFWGGQVRCFFYPNRGH